MLSIDPAYLTTNDTRSGFQLTNTLQKKLNDVRREKAELQAQIEREHKSHMVLQQQLSDLRSTQRSKAEALEEEDEMEEED